MRLFSKSSKDYIIKISDGDNIALILSEQTVPFQFLDWKSLQTLDEFADLATYDLIDKEEGIFREIDIEDDTIADTVKEEILDNPRKIGSANLMYVQDLIEKYCVNNPALSRDIIYSKEDNAFSGFGRTLAR